MEEKKNYVFLKDQDGSHDGFTVTRFKKGEIHALDEGLAEQLKSLNAVEETSKSPADSRETKVDGPESTKGGQGDVPLDSQNIEELVTLARDKYGLDVDSTMAAEDVRSLIEDAKEGTEGKKGRRKK